MGLNFPSGTQGSLFEQNDVRETETTATQPRYPLFRWFDGTTPFDRFTQANGSAPNSDLWDTAVTGEGSITIQSNQCMVGLSIEADGASTAILTLKTALITGKFKADVRIYGVGSYSASPAHNAGLLLQVGNATQGYTTVATIAVEGGHPCDFYTSVEGIYLGSNLWDVYVGNYKVQANLSLANGFKFRVSTSYPTYTQGVDVNPDPFPYVDNVYIQT